MCRTAFIVLLLCSVLACLGQAHERHHPQGRQHKALSAAPTELSQASHAVERKHFKRHAEESPVPHKVHVGEKRNSKVEHRPKKHQKQHHAQQDHPQPHHQPEHTARSLNKQEPKRQKGKRHDRLKQHHKLASRSTHHGKQGKRQSH